MCDKSLCYGIKNTGDKIDECKIRDTCCRFFTKGHPTRQVYHEPGPEFDSEAGCDLYED
jgi:hypothetical protein